MPVYSFFTGIFKWFGGKNLSSAGNQGSNFCTHAVHTQFWHEEQIQISGYPPKFPGVIKPLRSAKSDFNQGIQKTKMGSQGCCKLDLPGSSFSLSSRNPCIKLCWMVERESHKSSATISSHRCDMWRVLLLCPVKSKNAAIRNNLVSWWGILSEKMTIRQRCNSCWLVDRNG